MIAPTRRRGHVLISMMPESVLGEAFDDLVEGARRSGVKLTRTGARHLESLVHECGHALLLGIPVGPGMGPEISARLEALPIGERDANEVATLAIEVAVFRRWGFVGAEPPRFLKSVATALSESAQMPGLKELLVRVVMTDSESFESKSRASGVISMLGELDRMVGDDNWR